MLGPFDSDRRVAFFSFLLFSPLLRSFEYNFHEYNFHAGKKKKKKVFSFERKKKGMKIERRFDSSLPSFPLFFSFSVDWIKRDRTIRPSALAEKRGWAGIFYKIER